MDRLFRTGAIERGFLWVNKGEGKAIFGLKEVSANPPATETGETENV
jgi:hypothetical protein